MTRPKAQQTPLIKTSFAGLRFSGEVPERSNGADLKSADPQGRVGSNPTLSANLSPGGSANFHRGNLTTQPKATRSSNRIVCLSCVDFNRRVHDGLPQLPASSKAFR